MSEQTPAVTFVAAVLAGDAFVTDVDDWVDEWHEAPDDSEAGALELHEYLGLSWEEYRLFVERPESLRFTLAARRAQRPVEEVLRAVRSAGAAARSDEPGQAEAVLSWLIKTGRVQSLPRQF